MRETTIDGANLMVSIPGVERQGAPSAGRLSGYLLDPSRDYARTQ